MNKWSITGILLIGLVLLGLGIYWLITNNAASENSTTPGVEQSSNPNSLDRDDKNDLGISVLAGHVEKPQHGNEPRFVDLDPDTTGIDLEYVWDPPEKHKNFVNPIFGAGIAIGDIDNDGWQDVFVGRQTDAGRLYRNLGGMRFEDVTSRMGIDPEGMWTSGTTFVDINNDGLLDLYLCGFDCPNRLYINQGDKFVEQASEYGLDFNGCSIEMTFSDYDCDGDLDAFLVTNYLPPESQTLQLKIIRRPGQAPKVAPEFEELFHFVKLPDGRYRRVRGGQFDHLYRNDGGKFVDVTEESGIGLLPYMGLSANWWDYDQDGWPDLYVANDFQGPDCLFHNNGPDATGKVTFTDVIKDACPHTPWYSMGSDFADVNNDGRLDYLGTDMAGTNHYRDKLSMGNMSGPNSMAWFLNVPVPPQYMRNALYLNTGTSNFMEVAFLTKLAKSDWTWTAKFADLDNDGWQDVFFTNGMTRDLMNGDLLDELYKLEEAHKESGDKSRSLGDVAHEFWAKQEPFRIENLAFRNQGDLKFSDVSADWNLDHLGVSTGAAFGDLDNDGDLDLVVNGFEERVKTYRNDVADQNFIRIKLTGQQSNRNGLGATALLQLPEGEQQVRYASVTRGFMSTSEPILHFGIGESEQAQSLTIRWPSGCVQNFRDLDANQIYSVVEGKAGLKRASPPANPPMFASANLLDFNHRESDFDDFKRQPLLPNKYSQLGPGMAWGDIDRDGDNDLFVGGATYFAGQLMKNLGSGRFEPDNQDCFAEDSASEDLAPLFFDLEGDGDLDLYVVSGGVECDPGADVLQDRLYLNDGSGKFSRSELLPDMKFSGGCVAATDYDRDGKIDLFVGGRIVPGAYPESPRSVLLHNAGDRLTEAEQSQDGLFDQCGMVTSAVWSDVDKDNWPDLLVTTEWGPVRFFRNEKGQLSDQTDSAGLAERTGWYNSICSGDIDNDGDTDFVIGNFGLNTKYSASKKKPTVMFYGDFEGVGRKRIVEAKFENGECLPRRGLSCSSHAMPMIRDKLPTFHDFALADLSGIYTEEKLDEATRYEINDLESGVLINESDIEGDIRFTFRPLPRIAQASPIFGCTLNDVDGDGILDLYVVQNFYGPQRETGYMDGGVSLLFKGDGSGEFQPVDACDSGLVVTGDATSLTAVDLNRDGRVDFVVGRNNSSLLSFVNQIPQTTRAAALDQELKIGAKVLLKNPDGTRRLHEITAGGGYLSQSPPEIHGVSEVETIESPSVVKQ